MKAVVLNRTLPQGISIQDVTLGPLGDHDVRIELAAAALNHRDEWCRQGQYANLKDGIVLGSDGSGTVVEAGKSVDHSWIGKEVVINPALHWGDNQQAQGPDFRILGMPDNGTLAEFIQVPGDRIYSKPDHLTLYEAAALPLAGLTAFRALFYQGDLKPGQKVLVTGIGGGVAQFALQFALAQKAMVYVSSSSHEKLATAKSLGAEGGFIYSDPNWVEEAKNNTGGFDLVIDSAMGNTLGDLIDVIRPGGKLVFFGATLGNPSEINIRKVFWNQLTLKGTTMGSDRDFEEMLDFVMHHKIKPLVDQFFEFDQAISAFERMQQGAQMGKLVIKINQ
jgi:NADPH:quinone reductase-like Zn-dependent oxidoreductase